MRSTRCWRKIKAPAKLTAVVVLPTPPLKFAIAITRGGSGRVEVRGCGMRLPFHTLLQQVHQQIVQRARLLSCEAAKRAMEVIREPHKELFHGWEHSSRLLLCQEHSQESKCPPHRFCPHSIAFS